MTRRPGAIILSPVMISRAVCLASLAAATLGLRAAQPAAPPDTRALDAWLARQPTVRSLEATFTQERKLPTLKQPVVTEGRLAFLRPGMLRWELGTPAATVAVSDGTRLTLIDVAAKRARRMDADSPQARQFTILAGDAFRDRDSFRKNFEITAHQVRQGIHQYTVRPLDRRMRSKLPWMFLDIDPARNELRAMEIELPDHSRIRSVFREVILNPPLDNSRFQFPLEGYQVAG